MQFKSEDRVRRIGQSEVGTIKDIREPEEYLVRLNPYAETMYGIQFGEDADSCVWVKESQLELVELKASKLTELPVPSDGWEKLALSRGKQ